MVCAIYNSIFGVTPTFATWSISASVPLAGNAEKIRTVVYDVMQDETAFVNFLGMMVDVIDAATLGLITNTCTACGAFTTPMIFNAASGPDPDAIYGAGAWIEFTPWGGNYLSTGWSWVDRNGGGPSDWRRGVGIILTFTAAYITSVDIDFERITGGGGGNTRVWTVGLLGTQEVINSAIAGTGLSLSGPVNDTITEVRVFCVADMKIALPLLAGSSLVETFTFHGYGDKPPEWP